MCSFLPAFLSAKASSDIKACGLPNAAAK